MRHRRGVKAVGDDAVGKKTSIVKRVMIALAAIVFLAFFLIGYVGTDEMIPDYNAPRLTGVVIILTICFIAAALASVVWSAMKSMQRSKNLHSNATGIARRKIMTAVGIATLIIMAATFMLGNTDTLTINSLPFTNTTAIRLANMFITTTFAMLTIAILSTVASRLIAKQQKNAHQETTA